MTPAKEFEKELNLLAKAYGWDKLSTKDICLLAAALFHYYALRCHDRQ